MKTIIVHISIVDSKDPGVQEIKLEKTAPSEEIEVLASGMSTIFLKSKDALGISKKNGRRVVAIGRSIKK